MDAVATKSELAAARAHAEGRAEALGPITDGNVAQHVVTWADLTQGIAGYLTNGAKDDYADAVIARIRAEPGLIATPVKQEVVWFVWRGIPVTTTTLFRAVLLVAVLTVLARIGMLPSGDEIRHVLDVAQALQLAGPVVP
jgi:hypothetical protein